MTFLAPFFLLGSLAVALPIVLHLRRRSAVQPQPFPSLMFLAHVPVRTVKRRRIRDLGLLAARCAALLLAALLFARPTVSTAESDRGPEGGESVVVAVDRSMSMSAPDVVDRLRTELAARLSNPEDEIAVVAFDERAEVLQAFGPGDPTRTGAVLDAVAGGVGGTRYDAAARAARRLLLSVPEDRARRFVLLTDLQESGWTDRHGLGLGSGVEVEIVDLARAPDGSAIARPNATLYAIALERRDVAQRERVVVRATIQRRGTFPEAAVATLTVDEREVGSLPVWQNEPESEAGTYEVEFPPFTVDRETAHRGVVTVRAPGDSIPGDDHSRFVVTPRDSVEVLVVLAASRGSQLDGLYLQRALESVSAPLMRVSRVRADALGAEHLARASVVFVVDSLTQLDASSLAELERWVREGGGLFAAFGPRTDLRAESELPVGLRPPLATAETEDRRQIRGLLLAQPQHPVFSAFSGAASASALASTAVYRSHALAEPLTSGELPGTDPPGEVLVRLEDGTPLLVESSLGHGRIHWLGTPLDRTWSDLVLQPGFVPWIDHSARYLARYRPTTVSHRLGEVVPLQLSEAARWHLVSPDGERSPLAVAEELAPSNQVGNGEEPTEQGSREEVGGATGERGLALRLTRPGFWSVESDESGEGEVLAVNVDPAEADLRVLDAEEFDAAWSAGSSAPEGGEESPNEDAASAGPERFAWWVGLLLLCAVVVEGSVALARSSTVPGTTPREA